MSLPWEAVGQLTRLEEISLWTAGLGGAISADALCGLQYLHILALSQNRIFGTLPDCIRYLDLRSLWLESNRLHGPISVYSELGVFLKDVGSLNLQSNRWAPLLPSEKKALKSIAGPLGIAEDDHDWDFSYRYEWAAALPSHPHSTSTDRETSCRRWSAAEPETEIAVSFRLPFRMPLAGNFLEEVSIGQRGGFLQMLKLFEEPFRLVPDNLVATIDFPVDYTVELEITPDTAPAPHGWQNILRLTTTGHDCCGPGDRLLMIAFAPGSTFLYVSITPDDSAGRDTNVCKC